jgi:hypothetical protein
MIELARYQEGPASVVVSRDGDELRFRSSHDDHGRTITEESHIKVADFIAKGEGPWPWYDLGDKRNGTLKVLDALGADRPAWTTPLPDEVLDLFDRARSGSTEVIELLAWGAEPDPVDPCGASPLWYGVHSLSSGIVVAMIEAGADAGRRIELSARGELFTTILHEIVRLGRTVALGHALAKGVAPDLKDSDGATRCTPSTATTTTSTPRWFARSFAPGPRSTQRCRAALNPSSRRSAASCPRPWPRWSNSAPTPAAASMRCCPGGPPRELAMRVTAQPKSPTSSASCAQAAPK